MHLSSILGTHRRTDDCGVLVEVARNERTDEGYRCYYDWEKSTLEQSTVGQVNTGRDQHGHKSTVGEIGTVASKERPASVFPALWHLDGVLAVFLESDDVLLTVVQFHEIEFVLAGCEDANRLELLVELFTEFVEVWLVLTVRCGLVVGGRRLVGCGLGLLDWWRLVGRRWRLPDG
jgi:hypothetical protein